MDLPTSVRSDDGSGFGGGVDLRPPLSEYRSTVYHDSSDTVAMSRGGAAARGMGDPTVVGSGRDQICTGGLDGEGTYKGVVGGGGEVGQRIPGGGG